MNYLPTSVPGESMRRVSKIVLDNPDPDTSPMTRQITYYVEDKIAMKDGTFRLVSVGTLSRVVDEAELMKAFPVIDVNNGQSLGSSFGHELLQLLESHTVQTLKDNYGA